jgi:hypothetical protein
LVHIIDGSLGFKTGKRVEVGGAYGNDTAAGIMPITRTSPVC